MLPALNAASIRQLYVSCTSQIIPFLSYWPRPSTSNSPRLCTVQLLFFPLLLHPSSPLRKLHVPPKYSSYKSVRAGLPQATPRPSNPPRKLDILLHNSNSFRMYSAQIRIFKEVHEEGFGGFLERHDGLGLPAETFTLGTEGETDFSDL